MLREVSNRKYASIYFIYGFTNGNALHAVQEYRRRLLNRKVTYSLGEFMNDYVKADRSIV
jgi:hypothetical protein